MRGQMGPECVCHSFLVMTAGWLGFTNYDSHALLAASDACVAYHVTHLPGFSRTTSH